MGLSVSTALLLLVLSVHAFGLLKSSRKLKLFEISPARLKLSPFSFKPNPPSNFDAECNFIFRPKSAMATHTIVCSSDFNSVEYAIDELVQIGLYLISGLPDACILRQSP